MSKRIENSIAISLVLALLLTIFPLPINAQSAQPAALEPVDSSPADLTVHRTGADTAIAFRLNAREGEIAAAAIEDLGWPVEELNGHLLPHQTVAVIVDAAGGETTPFIVQSLDAIPWHGPLAEAAAQTPPALNPTEMPDYIQPVTESDLPKQPVTILREGRIRGQHVRVLAVSPIFQQNGQTMLARQFNIAVPNARPLEGTITDLIYATDGPVNILAADDLAPPNEVANQEAVKLLVQAGGLQAVALADLRAAGLNTDNPARLGVMRQGVSVPAQIDGGILFFFADGAGDYWNTADVYWVTDSGANVARMTSRSVPVGTAPLRVEAYEYGVWRISRQYTSLFPGPGGDHWFSTLMRANSSMPLADAPSIDASLTTRLPLSGSGELALQLRSTTRRRADYDVRIQIGAKNGDNFTVAATQTAAWDSRNEPSEENDWVEALPPVNVTAKDLRITLRPPEPTQSGGVVIESFAELYLDEVAWRQKVALNFQGSGATFAGYESSQTNSANVRYQLQNMPASFRLYDITDPLQPVQLTGYATSGSQTIFQDSVATVRTYLVAGPGTTHNPQVVAHTPTNVTAAANGAHLIYVAPAALHTTLRQLTDYRATQECRTGVPCQVVTVDVQAIYDAYSYGYVDPNAIRQYLRYAVANWNPAPISVVLVGDGTQDPRNYEGNEQSPDLIPPFLAYRVGDPAENTYVDPFIRQTGCENCFAQLDGADPLTGDEPIGTALRPGASFFPDIMLGRLPVKNAAELRDLIAKMLRYETEYDAWDPLNEKLVFLADNFVKSCDPDGPRDTAGDFATYSDEIIATLPDTLAIERIYYDPPQIYDPNDRDRDGSICDYATPVSSNGPREGNPATVYAKVQSTLRQAASLVTYNGHASQWRWAVTERITNSSSSVPQDAPEHLFYIWDVLSLNNADHLFVALSMSCLTSQFHKPVDWGMTLDEHLLLRANGGAVATWGSTGLSVAQGHFALERGFHETLWAKQGGRSRMGDLVMGGYLEQYTKSACCDDVRRTFMLMGDPMTRVRIGEIDGAYLPLVARE
jgi:hypothetical protein